MISVAEARARILAQARLLPAEQVALPDALDRVLAADVVARLSQPPADVSAMDGWAVRTADISVLPVTLRRIGESPAGRPFTGSVGPGEAVRIFTGGQIPAGADTVVIQEDCEELGGSVVIREGSGPGRWIRKEGLDFRQGNIGLRTGQRVGVRGLALAAAMNVPWLMVRRRPRVAILATGDEVNMPGEPLGPGQIVSSNGLTLAALVRRSGGEPVDLGVARDTPDSLLEHMRGAAGCDLLLTTGGVSVGEHDLVRGVLGTQGMELDFWKIALRPGKPLMFGRISEMPVIGLPGNPVSSLVCSVLFARPLLMAMQGLAETGPVTRRARLGADLPANDRREDYMRATSQRDSDGTDIATPFPQQDSSMLSRLAAADCLIVRPPLAPAAPAGSEAVIIPLDDL
ncbi:molybdopterin molybdotransferase MoeA [Indioceanicola profundi]|uniref:molybdopterin molybdotransferase MoeA n=1 Tax=Indioceanicola profundi TaxID=2220096 RepID=UPI000E6ACE02|nr:gephyrin-like molybdotransferase Glp [Indioceanicola profundi]